MKKQVKVTALTEKGVSIESGWFKELNKGEEYAAAMMQKLIKRMISLAE